MFEGGHARGGGGRRDTACGGKGVGGRWRGRGKWWARKLLYEKGEETVAAAGGGGEVEDAETLPVKVGGGGRTGGGQGNGCGGGKSCRGVGGTEGGGVWDGGQVVGCWDRQDEGMESVGVYVSPFPCTHSPSTHLWRACTFLAAPRPHLLRTCPRPHTCVNRRRYSRWAAAAAATQQQQQQQQQGRQGVRLCQTWTRNTRQLVWEVL